MPFNLKHDLFKDLNSLKTKASYQNWDKEGRLNAICDLVIRKLYTLELGKNAEHEQKKLLTEIIDIGLDVNEFKALNKAAESTRGSLSSILEQIHESFGLSYLEIQPDNIFINIAVKPGEDQLKKFKAALLEYNQKISTPEKLANRPVKVKGLDPNNPNQEVLNLLASLQEKTVPKNDEKNQQPHLSQTPQYEEGKPQVEKNKQTALPPAYPPKISRPRSVYNSSNPPKPGEVPTTNQSPPKKGTPGS